MKILIVEDQEEKLDSIMKFLQSHFCNHDVEFKVGRSLRSGLALLVQEQGVALIILDMSMPNYDPSDSDPNGGAPEGFAGMRFLEHMELRGLSIPTILITQYSTFADGQYSIEELDEKLSSSYGDFYKGFVHYSSASTDWHKGVTEYLRGVFSC